ncbi:MAG: hypothetical protein KC619_27605, partial [Myxococcales bacterium]|nr:hypothetical protein [Myxococcales bacterium]
GDPGDASGPDAGPGDDAGADDAGMPTDAGLDAAIPDAGDFDGGPSAWCTTPVVVPGGTTTVVSRTGGWVPRPELPGACGDRMCPTDAGDSLRSAYVFTLTETMQVSAAYPHMSVPDLWLGWDLSGDCAGPGAACYTPSQLRYGESDSQRLGPGTYQFDVCGWPPPDLTFEPPPPGPPNTSCAAAATVTHRTPAAPQLVSAPGTTLYYRIDATEITDFIPFDSFLVVSSDAPTTGSARVTLRTDCADPASAIADITLTYFTHSLPYWDLVSLSAANPAPAYYVVLSEIDPGLELRVEITEF